MRVPAEDMHGIRSVEIFLGERLTRRTTGHKFTVQE